MPVVVVVISSSRVTTCSMPSSVSRMQLANGEKVAPRICVCRNWDLPVVRFNSIKDESAMK